MASFDSALLVHSYHAILELGLENLQRASLPDLHEYLRVEIDHLHNIPSYMHSDNLFRHAYYYCTERPAYLNRVADYSLMNVDRLISRYEQHWNALYFQLAPHAEAINAKKYTEKL